MWAPDDFDSDSSAGTVFRDVLMLTLVGFVAIVILMLPHLNKAPKDQQQEHFAPGHLIIESHWPDDMTADVDLWVKGPNGAPVGFYNPDGRFFNLLRDDRGEPSDPSRRNYEVTYRRGIDAGEYIVNVHMYGAWLEPRPVPITVVVSVRKSGDDLRQLLRTELLLSRHNQEETAFRFRLTGDGNLVPNSVSTLTRLLVTAPDGWES